MSPSHFRSIVAAGVIVGMQLLSGFAAEPGEPASAGSPPCCSRCGSPCQAARLVERTIMVPMTVVEKRQIQTCVVNKKEIRKETYTEFVRVPVKRQFIKEECYLEDQIKTQPITEKHCRIVCKDVVSNYTVMVPHQETREITERKQICTECGPVWLDETRTCDVTVLKPETRTETYQEPDVVFETTKRDISYCVKEPKKRTQVCRDETVYEFQPVEKTRDVEVCVPEIVKKQVEVFVCRMVPQTILCCETCAKHGH